VVLHILEHRRTDRIKCIVSQLQPDVVSQPLEDYAHGERLAGWLELANDAFYLIGSAVYGVLMNHKSTTEDFYFSPAKC
jgi:hypothetical protein